MDRASYPSPSFGYWRGGGSDGPFWRGQGSDMGPKLQGLGVFTQGQGPASGSSWDPSIGYLFLLVIAEMFVFGFISRALR